MIHISVFHNIQGCYWVAGSNTSGSGRTKTFDPVPTLVLRRIPPDQKLFGISLAARNSSVAAVTLVKFAVSQLLKEATSRASEAEDGYSSCPTTVVVDSTHPVAVSVQSVM